MPVDDLWFLKQRDPETGDRLPAKRHGRGKRWRVRFTDDTGEKVERLFSKRSDADRFDVEMRADVNRGLYIDPAAGRQTVQEYGEQLHAGMMFNRESTADNMERSLRLHAYPTLGKRQLHAVRRSHIQSWVSGLDHLAPKTVNMVYRYAAQLFNAAVVDRAIGRTPCLGIALPAVTRDTRTILTSRQVHDLAASIRAEFSAGVYIAAGCGLRPGELVGLELEHVDFSRREVTVAQQVVARRGDGLALGPPKSSSSRRVVEMPKAVVTALSRHIEQFPLKPIEVTDATDPSRVHVRPAEMLFPSPSGKLSSRNLLSRIWREAADKAGVPEGEGWHALRHYFATSLIYAGANVQVVQLALGHASPMITLNTYLGYWPEDTADRTRRLIDDALGDAELAGSAEGVAVA